VLRRKKGGGDETADWGRPSLSLIRERGVISFLNQGLREKRGTKRPIFQREGPSIERHISVRLVRGTRGPTSKESPASKKNTKHHKRVFEGKAKIDRKRNRCCLRRVESLTGVRNPLRVIGGKQTNRTQGDSRGFCKRCLAPQSSRGGDSSTRGKKDPI